MRHADYSFCTNRETEQPNGPVLLTLGNMCERSICRPLRGKEFLANHYEEKDMRHVHTMAALVLSLACGFVSSALAQPAPGTAEDFAVLAGVAVTCTDSTVNGNVGLANPGTITNTGCAINGATEEGTLFAQEAYADFVNEYANVKTMPSCDFYEVPLAGAFLPPGVYCYDAAVTVTGGTLTLVGSAANTWIFRIGTGGTGALTGTNFTVVLTGGATCNNDVLWWTAEAAKLTDSTFTGNILAGADITITRGNLAGQVLAGGTGTNEDTKRTGAVTLTGAKVDYCPANTPPPVPPLLPVFVIGDVEHHAVGDVVNFWGAQWWKNNIMSGFTGPGASRASFKGFATSAPLLCGGVWKSRPGNSAPPPATIPADIAVVVTSTVVKDGPDLSGNIKQIVVVHQDGGYGPNPGHDGNGRITSIVCKQQEF
ncbi:MAG: ice-binding family protein [Usitatibacter sp.]